MTAKSGRNALRSQSSVLVALLLATLGVAPARAGTLHVQLGTTPTGCTAQSWYATGLTGNAFCANRLSIFDYGGGWQIEAASLKVSAGATGEWQINAPSGIAIESVSIPTVTSTGLVSSTASGWRAGDYWAGDSTTWGPHTTTVMQGQTWPMNSSYYGFKLYCYASSCNNQGSVQVREVDLTASESQGPGLTAVGANNLWYQAGQYVWNPPGAPFSIELDASDPSGVCSVYAYAGAVDLHDTPSTPNVSDGFQQCPSPVDWTPGQNAEVDTDQIVPVGSSGSFPLQLNAVNAAGVTSSVSETVEVDQVQPAVTLTTPNDANPGGWSVNHAVTVDAAVHTGPSGVSSLTCSVDHGAMKPYTSAGVSVSGNGKHVVICVVANQAVDPQGAHNTGSSSMTIDIDEQPVTLSFDPQDPSNPAQVVVDSSDSESSVAGGQIEMAPQGTTNWTQIPTTFASNGQLIATIPDAGLSGPYTIQATACSQVGNCGSASETLTMPLRTSASSDVSFDTIVDPLVAEKVKERVLVGWHWAAVLSHGQAVKVKRGGHYKTITVIKMVEQCTRKRVKVAKHRWKLTRTCKVPRIALRDNEHVEYGQSVTVHGLLLTSQDLPIGDTPVQIWTAPNNQLGQFTQLTTTTTSPQGAWSATLPAGPSRIVQARYGGSATILPATGQATVTVPAKITITSITPRHIPWGATITITGELSGGYLPPGGALIELRYSYGDAQTTYGVKTHVSTRTFTTTFTFGPGQTPLTFGFGLATLPTADYPYTPAASNIVDVRVG
ncbi:MAG: hypothetical protein ACLP50_17605 [Solirubrobacteraceae bacterium]